MGSLPCLPATQLSQRLVSLGYFLPVSGGTAPWPLGTGSPSLHRVAYSPLLPWVSPTYGAAGGLLTRLALRTVTHLSQLMALLAVRLLGRMSGSFPDLPPTELQGLAHILAALPLPFL